MKFKFSLILGSLLIAIAIAIAILFVLSTVGIIPTELSKVLISWQALIVLIGMLLLFIKLYINALFILIVGAYFLIPHIFSTYGVEMPIQKTDLTTIFIASLLIVGGFAIIFGSKKWNVLQSKFSDITINKDGSSLRASSAGYQILKEKLGL